MELPVSVKLQARSQVASSCDPVELAQVVDASQEPAQELFGNFFGKLFGELFGNSSRTLLTSSGTSSSGTREEKRGEEKRGEEKRGEIVVIAS